METWRHTVHTQRHASREKKRKIEKKKDLHSNEEVKKEEMDERKWTLVRKEGSRREKEKGFLVLRGPEGRM